MPHFDAYGGDEWVCQVCLEIKDSRTKSFWRTDITENESAGNVCTSCLRAHEQTGLKGSQLRQHAIA